MANQAEEASRKDAEAGARQLAAAKEHADSVAREALAALVHVAPPYPNATSIANMPSDPSMPFAALLICLPSNAPFNIIGRDEVCQGIGVPHVLLFKLSTIYVSFIG